jgi:hypothetical protein
LPSAAKAERNCAGAMSASRGKVPPIGRVARVLPCRSITISGEQLTSAKSSHRMKKASGAELRSISLAKALAGSGAAARWRIESLI